jgi:16S rRNA (uracil1498-N3)-methyltransferase
MPSTPRLYVDQALLLGAFVLPEPAFRHAVQVLRLNKGDPLTLFNGDGLDYPATLVEVQKRSAVVEIGVGWPVVNESNLHITLGLAVSKGERMDFALQKATELGVNHVVPLQSERSVVKLDAERRDKKHEHWRGVLVSACEQSGRATLPSLAEIQPLEAWLTHAKASLKLVLSPDGGQRLRDLASPSDHSIALLIGPEGGLSAAEVALAQQHGFLPLQLGKRILRTETAPLAVLAALQAQWGDF